MTELAQYDGLTQIYNRRTFTDIAQQMIISAECEIVSFMMFDIDYFKSVNDLYGHDIGDEVLIEISNLVQNFLRKDEIMGRLGGEEFGVLLPMEKENALSIANRILNAINSNRFTSLNLDITVSIGVVDSRFSNIFDSMYKEADRLLYSAKNAGRNQISI